MLDGNMQLRRLTSENDAAVAELIRTNLKAYQLDIPGTVYYDDSLDHLSDFYDDPGRAYYVLLQDGQVVGGIGLAEFDFFESCCELQKLYLSNAVKGRDGYVIKPQSNVTESEAINIESGKIIKLDLNGKTVTLDNVSMDYLSMGMSDDFSEAIQSGANMIRVGSRLFGARIYR